LVAYPSHFFLETAQREPLVYMNIRVNFDLCLMGIDSFVDDEQRNQCLLSNDHFGVN